MCVCVCARALSVKVLEGRGVAIAGKRRVGVVSAASLLLVTETNLVLNVGIVSDEF